MAVTSRKGRTTDLQMCKQWKERETSPERTKVWTEPPNNHKKVPVVYYLSRNGQLEHPHFMEVTFSSPEGLYLRDVINRLNTLRGKGMATMYSWSAKRSYKNGFVWHDLLEDDFIYPAQGQEYILKGSELLENDTLISKPDEVVPSTSKIPPPENQNSNLITRRRNQSWSSIDLHEYKVYKAESPGDLAGKAAADAATQTDDKRRRRRAIKESEEEQNEVNESSELSRDEISPPPSDSSPETLESLMKADGSLVLRTGEVNDSQRIGRAKTSSVLMQLITCGSISFRDCGPAYGKDHPGFSLISHYKTRLPRHQVGKELNEGLVGNGNGRFGGERIKVVEDKEYFSGSLIETKKDEFSALKRSSSYNADRSSHMVMRERERDGVTAKCIPRKPKAQTARKEGNNDVSCSTSSSCNNQQGPKQEKYTA